MRVYDEVFEKDLGQKNLIENFSIYDLFSLKSFAKKLLKLTFKIFQAFIIAFIIISSHLCYPKSIAPFLLIFFFRPPHCSLGKSSLFLINNKFPDFLALPIIYCSHFTSTTTQNDSRAAVINLRKSNMLLYVSIFIKNDLH